MRQQLIRRRSSDQPMHHADPRRFKQHEINGGRDAVIWFGQCCAAPTEPMPLTSAWDRFARSATRPDDTCSNASGMRRRLLAAQSGSKRL